MLKISLQGVHAFERASAGPGRRWVEADIFIEIKELEAHPVDFDQQFRPGEIDFGSEFTQQVPLKASGRAQLVEENYGKHQKIQDIRLTGELAGKFELACARCLEAVEHAVARPF